MAVKEQRTTHGVEETLAFGRAADELGLKPRELETAVLLEEVRTVAVAGTGRRRVPRVEVERLRAADGFPEALLDRLRLVGTAEGAELMGIGPGRFTRLARVGCFSPVKFYVNRYRAVVWLYAAAELRRFAEKEPQLLSGGTPQRLRAMLEAGEDWRARNWRSRRIGQLVRQTDDPWERAAVSAAVLGADELADVVDDPYERAYLRRLRPALVPVRVDAGPSWSVVEGLLTADDPDEILWQRLSLILALDAARAVRSAPRPGAPDSAADLGPAAHAVPALAPAPEPGPGESRESAAPGPQSRGLRKWLRGRSR